MINMIIQGFGFSLLCAVLIWIVFKVFFFEVEDEHAVLVTRFGALAGVTRKPGLHFLPGKILPWVRTIPVSLQRDFRHYPKIHINDCRGTSLVIDLWIEFRVVEPEKALFDVDHWEKALESLLIHASTSVLVTREFSDILRARTEIGAHLREDVSNEAHRWGLAIELVLIRQVSLLPEVSRRMFDAVAARLERAKADVEEEGRLKVAMLEAQTSARVAQLVAEAKGQYSVAIGSAFEQLKKSPSVFKAYQELYRLSLVQPGKTVSFEGFSQAEIRASDLAMIGSSDISVPC